MTGYSSRFRVASPFFLLALLTACGEAKHPPVVPAADSTSQVVVGSRGRLIEALKEVRRLIASNDSQQIALLFRFPIAASNIPLSGDAGFEREKAKNGDQITRALFLSGYGLFKQELQFEEMDSAYRKLDIGKLLSADSVGFVDTAKNKVCVHGYSIQIREDSLVYFEAFGNPISGYTGGASEDPQCEEYLLDWEYVFDGKRLYLRAHSEAD
jgi:hypothetical protein